MASKTLVIKIEKNDDEQRMNNYRYGIPTDLAKFISEKWHVCECAHEDFKQTCWYDLKMLLKTLTRFSDDDDEQREVYEILISIIEGGKDATVGVARGTRGSSASDRGSRRASPFL